MYIVDLIREKVSQAYWWVRYRTTNRYHVMHTGLEPGYYDPSDRILHAVMEEVTRFYDRAEVQWDATEDHRIVGDTLRTVTQWWVRYKQKKADYATREYPVWNDTEGWRVVISQEEDEEREADEMLKLVMGIRKYLWYP